MPVYQVSQNTYMQTTERTGTSLPSNPFPGLRPFRTEEKYLFFGREEQTAELLMRLRRTRFLAVVGTSGSGKSSLVRAGLLPELHGGTMVKAGSSWEVAVMRPGGDPVSNLVQALCQSGIHSNDSEELSAQIRATLTRSGLGLVEAVRQAALPPGTNLLVVVDQFEEIFRFRQRGGEHQEEAGAFIELLLEASRQSAHPIYVVLTMRSDFLGDCSQFRGLAEAVNSGEYLIPRLNRNQLRSAIEGPVKVGGGQIAPRLVQKLLNDVGDDQDQLPILQHALMRSWDFWRVEAARSARSATAEEVIGAVPGSAERPGGPAGVAPCSPAIDLQDYEAIGGMKEALSRHADEVFDELPGARHRQLAEQLFRALTEKGPDNRGIRRPTRLGALAEILGTTHAELSEITDQFRGPGRTFLMPAESVPLQPETVIDISHESLMRIWKRLEHWVEEEAQSARIYRRLADTAILSKDGKAGLYRDPDLQIALSWRDANQPNRAWANRYSTALPEAIQFLEASRQARDAEKEARELARRQELDQVKALAEGARLRAEEQARFAARLKWLVRGLGLIAMIAVAALVSALAARKLAQTNAALALQNEARAKQNAAEARRQAALAGEKARDSVASLVRLNFSTGVRLIEADDPLGALPWLGEAMRLVEGDSEQEATHRFRLNFLLSRTSRLLQILTNQANVNMASFSPDGTQVAAACADGAIRIWDAATGHLVQTLKQNDGADSAIFSPDGNRLVISGSQTRVWDIAAAKDLFPPLAQSESGAAWSPNGAVFSPDGRRIVTRSSYDQTARVWNADTGEPITPPLRHNGYIYDAAFSPDGQRIVTAGYGDRVAKVWDATTGKAVCPPLGHEGGVSTAKFSPDLRRIVTASYDRTARIWDALTGESLVPSLKHPEAVFTAAFSPDGSKVVTSARDGAIRIWSASSGDPLTPAIGGEGGFPFAPVEFSPDGRRIVASFGGGYARVFDAATGRSLTPPLKQTGTVRYAIFSPEGRRIATSSSDGTVRIWDIGGEETESRILKHHAAVSDVDLSDNGGCLVTASMDGLVGIWNAKNLEPITRPLVHPAAVTDVDLSPDGTKIATACWDGAARIWDAMKGTPLLKPLEHEAAVREVAFSPDGSLLAAADFDRGATIWDLSTGSPLWRLTNEFVSALLMNIAFSPDGKSILTAGGTNGARLWNSRTGETHSPPIKSDELIRQALFSPDGARVLTLGGKEARLWDARSANPALPPFTHSAAVVNASFAKNGHRIVTISADRMARVWDAITGQPVTPNLAHPENVVDAIFSPDSRYVVTTTFPGYVRIWDAATGQPIPPTLKQGARIMKMVFSPDSTRLFTAGLDQLVRTWGFPAEDRPKEQLRAMANLWASASVDSTGGLEPLSSAQQMAELQMLRKATPQQFALAATDIAEWHRREAATSEETRQWFATCFHLRRLAQLQPEDREIKRRLERAESQWAAAKSVPAGTNRSPITIPPRDPAAKPEQIDLSTFYHAALDETWHAGSTDNHLGGLPRGLATIAGVQFDLRGVVQLAGRALGITRFPQAVNSIPVNLKCRRLHLLHSTGYGGLISAGTQIGAYRIHYANGETREAPIVYSQDLREWWAPLEPVSSKDSVVAWVGTNPARLNRWTVSLYRTGWQNPLPDIEIKTIDYVSAMTPAAPFLIAITAE